MNDDLIVMCSGAFADVLDRLLSLLQPLPDCAIRIVRGPSIGTSARALPFRLRAGEASDLAILFEDAVDSLLNEGILLPGTKVRLASSVIGVAARRGGWQPDIGTSTSLRQALVDARSFAYSSSASGVYVSTRLIGELGLSEDVMRRGIRVEGEPVGAVVARGEAELGFQQISELVSIEGIVVLGPLPNDVQETRFLSAALPATCRNPSAARGLVALLVSAEARPIMIEAGLAPS